MAFLHYDGGVYQLDALGDRRLKAGRDADVSKLNRWTIENCANNIYFRNWESGEAVRQACLEANEGRLNHEAVIRVYAEVEPGKFEFRPDLPLEGVRKSLLVFNVRQVQSRLALSFFRPRAKPQFVATSTGMGPLRRGGWAELVSPLIFNEGLTQMEMLRIARAVPTFSREVWRHFADIEAELLKAAKDAGG